VPARKMRVEVYDDAGNRYTISFEGRVTREKALRVFDMVELLGGMPSIETESEIRGGASKIDKVRFAVERQLPLVWFTAKEAHSIYETELNEPISLSTISTYLSRLANHGVLLRSRASNKVRYRLVTQTLEKVFSVENSR